MKDRFKAKTWVYQIQFLICTLFAIISLSVGYGFWTGSMKDAGGEQRTGAGPPLMIMGIVFAVIAVMAEVNLLGRRKPVLRCFQQGIECILVGRAGTTVWMPRMARLAYAILSGKGFQTLRFRVEWSQFGGAAVDGVAMMYRIILQGNWVDMSTFESANPLILKQVALVDAPKEVAETLNQFRKNSAERAKLALWK